MDSTNVSKDVPVTSSNSLHSLQVGLSSIVTQATRMIIGARRTPDDNHGFDSSDFEEYLDCPDEGRTLSIMRITESDESDSDGETDMSPPPGIPMSYAINNIPTLPPPGFSLAPERKDIIGNLPPGINIPLVDEQGTAFSLPPGFEEPPGLEINLTPPGLEETLLAFSLRPVASSYVDREEEMDPTPFGVTSDTVRPFLSFQEVASDYSSEEEEELDVYSRRTLHRFREKERGRQNMSHFDRLPASADKIHIQEKGILLGMPTRVVNGREVPVLAHHQKNSLGERKNFLPSWQSKDRQKRVKAILQPPVMTGGTFNTFQHPTETSTSPLPENGFIKKPDYDNINEDDRSSKPIISMTTYINMKKQEFAINKSTANNEDKGNSFNPVSNRLASLMNMKKEALDQRTTSIPIEDSVAETYTKQPVDTLFNAMEILAAVSHTPEVKIDENNFKQASKLPSSLNLQAVKRENPSANGEEKRRFGRRMIDYCQSVKLTNDSAVQTEMPSTSLESHTRRLKTSRFKIWNYFCRSCDLSDEARKGTVLADFTEQEAYELYKQMFIEGAGGVYKPPTPQLRSPFREKEDIDVVDAARRIIFPDNNVSNSPKDDQDVANTSWRSCESQRESVKYQAFVEPVSVTPQVNMSDISIAQQDLNTTVSSSSTTVSSLFGQTYRGRPEFNRGFSQDRPSTGFGPDRDIRTNVRRYEQSDRGPRTRYSRTNPIFSKEEYDALSVHVHRFASEERNHQMVIAWLIMSDKKILNFDPRQIDKMLARLVQHRGALCKEEATLKQQFESRLERDGDLEEYKNMNV